MMETLFERNHIVFFEKFIEIFLSKGVQCIMFEAQKQSTEAFGLVLSFASLSKEL
jgi:hypothetical protein